jgi:hypothetical protein
MVSPTFCFAKARKRARQSVGAQSNHSGENSKKHPQQAHKHTQTPLPQRMNFAARSKGSKPVPPLKGSFPLDHVGDCKALMAEYMGCLRTHEMKTTPCRSLARDYFACRVDL